MPNVSVHPNLAAVYRKKVEELETLLEDAQHKDEAIELIRSLIDKIVLTPKEGGDVDALLHGDLARILSLCSTGPLNTMSLLKRDPGIEAAVDDLYAAAAVLVKDASSGTPLFARSLRLLLSASDRFCNRLTAAVGRIDPEPEMRLKGLEAAYAVQLERVSVTTDLDADLDPVGQVA